MATRDNKALAVEQAVNAYEPLERAPYESDKKVHFLDYMATEQPYIFVPYALYLRAIRGLGRTPSPNSPDVIKLANGAGNIREKLYKKYNRDLHILPGYGVRASVDEDDRLSRHYALQSRAKNAVAKVTAHAATINTNLLKDVKAKAAFIETRKTLGAMNQSMAKIAALLPAKPELKEDKKK
jgi:hypothetical protein